MFELIAILIVLTAVFSYVNYRYLRMPFAIGVMSLTLGASLLTIGAGHFYPQLSDWAEDFVNRVEFSEAVLHGMLGFLLFAGALEIKLGELRQYAVSIAVMATAGVILSTALIGGCGWLIAHWIGYPVSLVNCLLFGALISPTDPVAVIGVLKKAGIPKSLEVKIAGESLFNDGVAVVVFFTVLRFATRDAETGAADVVWDFVREAGGGALFGAAVGLVAFWLMRSIDHYQTEILISLALVAGGYAAAEHLHISAPMAVVVAGLIIGNQGRSYAMSSLTVENLDLVWEIVDEVLNGILFVLIGLEVLVLRVTKTEFAAGAVAIAVVLFARFASVYLPVVLVRRWQPLERGALAILTWGGLRGGISVAMALSLPASLGDAGMPDRNWIVVMTYAVAVFSLLVQGLTLERFARWRCFPSTVSSRPELVPASSRDTE